MVNVRVFLLFCAFGLSLASTSFWRGRDVDEFHGDTLTLPPGKTLPTEEWFEQQVDPYDPGDHKTFQQRYFTNSEYFKSQDGPVFLLIGRPGPANPRWMVEGSWLKYAQEFGALCIQLEHRYFGKSHPTQSITTKEYIFASSEINLTDIALFIAGMQKKLNLTDKNRWIVFGGGYSGSLASWMRVKFPHLVHGAVSSSGPVVVKLDFREYYEAVSDTILDCRMSVQGAFNELEDQFNTGSSSLIDQFKLCDPVEATNELDKSTLFENLASIFARVVQSNGLPYAKHSVKEVCSIMNDEAKGSPLERLATLSNIFLEEDGKNCLDYKYDKIIQDLKQTSWDAPVAVNGNRHWFLDQCKEIGYFQTSTNASFVFGNNFQLDYFLKQCLDVLGERFSQTSVEKYIYNDFVIYGGLGIKASNTIYVQGSADPWHTVGLTEANSSKFRAVFMKGTAHCADMFEPREDDLPELKAGRSQVREFLAEILNQNE